jgi:dynein heavy chain
MDSLFQEHKDHPPLHKNHPPVAGAIYWEKSLFLRIKHTIIRFQSMEEMMTSDQGKAARAKYLHVAKQMKAYEDHKYEQWKDYVEQVLPSLLKRNLLIKPAEKLQQQQESGEATTLDKEEGGKLSDANIFHIVSEILVH